MFLWYFLFVFSTLNSPSTIPVAKVISTPLRKTPPDAVIGVPVVEEKTLSPAERKAMARTRQFVDALNVLGQAKGPDISNDVKPSVETVQSTIKDILTVATSNLPDTPEMRRLQRLARQIMNVLIMILFEKEGEEDQTVVEELIMALVENKTSPVLAEKLSALVPALANRKIRELLNDEKMGVIFQGQITSFYKAVYELDPAALKVAQSHFNRNVAITAFALTFAGVVASIALGATIIGLPAALGLLLSTIGGPGSMAVQAWNKHKTDQLIGQAAPTMGTSFKAILVTLEQLKAQIENLEKQINTNCPNPTTPASPSKLDRAKQFFARLGS
jgi:hypothetical protein